MSAQPNAQRREGVWWHRQLKNPWPASAAPNIYHHRRRPNNVLRRHRIRRPKARGGEDGSVGGGEVRRTIAEELDLHGHWYSAVAVHPHHNCVLTVRNRSAGGDCVVPPAAPDVWRLGAPRWATQSRCECVRLPALADHGMHVTWRLEECDVGHERCHALSKANLVRKVGLLHAKGSCAEVDSARDVERVEPIIQIARLHHRAVLGHLLCVLQQRETGINQQNIAG